MDSAFISHAEKELARLDPQLGNLIGHQELRLRGRREDYFASLCRSIIGQQVSVAAATAIFARLELMTGLIPAAVGALSEEMAKTIGLSRQKTGYLKDLAEHFAGNPDVYTHLEHQTDEQVIAELIAVKGIGVWTAQMFLMFTLLRPDVFAPDDAGLQRGMMRLYGWDKLPDRRTILSAAEQWQPYRTIASFHLWQSLDAVPAGD